MTPPERPHVGVIGAGTMGAGIAALAAVRGCTVTLIDADAAALERARTRIARDADRAGTPDAASRVTTATDVEALAAVDVAIEAIFEDLAAKRACFARLEGSVRPGTLLATNTSALSVAEIGAQLAHPERFLGLHFFNPPLAMRLVEVVRAPETSDAAIARATAFVDALERTPVTVADTPGFIVNRVARPFYLQALRALDRGVADAASLDTLARGAGFPMGPFALMDLIGIDVNDAVSRAVYDRLHAERLQPSPVQARMIAAGTLGRKTGSGFFSYAPASHVPAAQTLAAQGPRTPVPAAEAPTRDAAESAPLAEVTLLDPDGVLAPLATAVRGRGTTVREVRELADAATASAPIVYDAYRFDAADMPAHGSQRHAGIGVVGSLADQRAVEVTGDATLGAALLAGTGIEGVAVREAPGLYLGATIASIINEAFYAREEGVAGEPAIDLALELGVRYPRGPFAWCERIGRARVAAILEGLAQENAAYAPHPALLATVSAV